MRKSPNFFLDFTFWCAQNNHFGLWPHFTSNLWFKLCETLNILHLQTTPYLSQLGQSKDCTATSSAAAATWSEELPFVLLGLRAQPREDTGLSPAEAIFGALIVLPNEFLQNEEISVDSIKNFF
jgi:hypothetical protein